MPSAPIEISGKRFNLLTAVRFVERRRTNTNGGKGVGLNHFWEFKCDCGNTTITNKNSVMRGSVKSCGCLHKANVSRKPIGHAALTHVFHYYKSRARMTGKVFSLTKSEFKTLVDKNCYYCGSAPSNVARDKTCNGEYTYNGLDRIENDKGYQLDNVVPCCAKCNTAKSTMSKKEFLTHVVKIYDTSIKGDF